MKFARFFGYALAGALSLSAATSAQAFCGFYVSGADAKLFNDATMVAMMRNGNRTVLSMRNTYQGPAEDFAMVVPVPVVLQKENVKTLSNEVFDRLDQLAAPRLVEYWEQDPCFQPDDYDEEDGDDDDDDDYAPSSAPPTDVPSVTIEAQFVVGEYEVVVLSASDSTGLDTWLRGNGYKIPAGAEPLLRPYVTEGMKFFVAKVNSKKVKRDQTGRVSLSPLRFHYDTDTFRLPVRLGLINANGKQDLIVHILAPGVRYEAANYNNITIPTNIDVQDAVREDFGGFYASLFDATVARNPNAVITEYSWDASSCDPCPVPALDPSELKVLGSDVLGEAGQSFVLTRMHMRYDGSSMGQDLVFRKATGIMGGREVTQSSGKLEKGAQPSPSNNFQGRYAIRHAWTGPVECADPRFGNWGPPPGGVQPLTIAAKNTAFASRDASLDELVAEPVAELEVQPVKAKVGPGRLPPAVPANSRGCACDMGSQQSAGFGFGAAIAALGLALTRRRKR